MVVLTEGFPNIPSILDAAHQDSVGDGRIIASHQSKALTNFPSHAAHAARSRVSGPEFWMPLFSLHPLTF